MDMTKFDSLEDPGFTAITGELRRWVKELGFPRNVDEPREKILQQQEVTQKVQSLSLGGSSGAQSIQPIPQTQNGQNLEHQESQPQNIADVRDGSSHISPPVQTPLHRQTTQPEARYPNAPLESTPPAQTIPTASPAPGAGPSGINIAGTGGDIRIGSSEQYLSGNFYGGVHLAP
jgi:hypothetical protein